MTDGRGAAVLVLNCGSSSVKYRLVEPDGGAVRARGLVERVGHDDAAVHHENVLSGMPPTTSRRALPDHAAALDAMVDAFGRHGPDLDGARPAADGHRVVHGGERFSAPALVDDEVLTAVRELAVLAPLHNPANLDGITVARRLLPDVPHVAVFDTAFHAGLPARAATYAVPTSWRTGYGVRRYGFHGTSHAYVSRETARFLGRPPEQTNTVVLHLGNGASACAVAGGRSIDTSMGLTPLQGLVMGTRSGDVDPALPAHLTRVAGLSGAEVDEALNTRSGLLGLAGTSDVRDVTERAAAGDADARLALDVYCYRVRCYVGAYAAALGRLDAVTFTAGVGENSAVVRARCLTGLDAFGIVLDPARNAATSAGGARLISADDSRVAVLVVPTDEEREIARQALEVARR